LVSILDFIFYYASVDHPMPIRVTVKNEVAAFNAHTP